MSWARYDDELPMNRKVGALRARGVDGIAALGLHLLANTYCRHNGTAGHVEPHVPELLAGKPGKKLAKILEEIGMFDTADSGWMIHDYEHFHDPNDPNPNQSAADRKRDLSEKRAKAGRLGGQRKASNRLANAGSATATVWQSSSPVPVPVPTTQVTTPPTDCVAEGDRVAEIADAYTAIAYERATGVSDERSWKRATRARIAADTELARLAALFPTAPADAVAAWLHGDKGSMAYYPRVDELAEVVPITRKDEPA